MYSKLEKPYQPPRLFAIHPKSRYKPGMIRYNPEGRPNHSAPSIRRTIYWKAKGWTQTGLTFESRKMRINIIKPAVSVALHICTCQGSSDIMYMYVVVKSVRPSSDAAREYFSLVTSSVGLLEDCIMHDIRYDIDSGDR